MKQLITAFQSFTKFEKSLWLISMLIVTASFLLAPGRDYLTLTASLIGVTALIFVAKGKVLGQLLTVVFAIFYGIISFYFQYYGEMITYLCMTTPMAIVAAVEWSKHPYAQSSEVKIEGLSVAKIVGLFVLSVLVTILFYFILAALNTANLFMSTLSVTTSFLASGLTYLRSPYYALAYAANDVVLIILWIMASMVDISYLPMILCFVMFLANDIYGFLNWKHMAKRQAT